MDHKEVAMDIRAKLMVWKGWVNKYHKYLAVGMGFGLGFSLAMLMHVM
jgi:hypothetical protein